MITAGARLVIAIFFGWGFVATPVVAQEWCEWSLEETLRIGSIDGPDALSPVVAQDGTPRGALELPVGSSVHWSDRSHLWVVEPDAFDVPWLVRYRMEASGGVAELRAGLLQPGDLTSPPEWTPSRRPPRFRPLGVRPIPPVHRRGSLAPAGGGPAFR